MQATSALQRALAALIVRVEVPHGTTPTLVRRKTFKAVCWTGRTGWPWLRSKIALLTIDTHCRLEGVAFNAVLNCALHTLVTYRLVGVAQDARFRGGAVFEIGGTTDTLSIEHVELAGASQSEPSLVAATCGVVLSFAHVAFRIEKEELRHADHGRIFVWTNDCIEVCRTGRTNGLFCW